MIKIGVDMIEIERIKSFIKENIDNLERIFSAEEINYCNSKKNKYENFAARFAAKEAVIKALDDKTLAMNNILVVNSETGKPFVGINDARYLDINKKISLSLSHCRDYAVAFVVIEI